MQNTSSFEGTPSHTYAIDIAGWPQMVKLKQDPKPSVRGNQNNFAELWKDWTG